MQNLPIGNNRQQYKHARLYCWQWTKFTMGPNKQNQNFVELRQKLCLYIYVVVLQRGLPSLDVKSERFVTKKRKKRLPNSSQTDYRKHLKMQLGSKNVISSQAQCRGFSNQGYIGCCTRVKISNCLLVQILLNFQK